MVATCIIIAFALILCGSIISKLTSPKKKKKHPAAPRTTPPPSSSSPTPSPPPLPPRIDHAPPPVSSHVPRPLPPRRPSTSGPQGLTPTQFPCCPLCKCRNRVGERQVIFWDSGADGYRCPRGHLFRKNGKPF